MKADPIISGTAPAPIAPAGDTTANALALHKEVQL
jgi:hypothetical protein